MADHTTTPVVRTAGPRDHLGVMRVLDGANLAVDAATVANRIEAGTVVVADHDNRIVGALVAVPRHETGAHVEAVAVRRRRRGQGIGSRLVGAATIRWRPLTANFDPGVKPFYDGLGFDCERRGERYRGVLG
ncbi:GNAT family acetyltransferase [Halobacterium salinarum R1]|uniref:GNAT family acetyltransferase n=2 Tax=Halobacterium salinarum NRC-34001 TaxID=2886895 RepID=A0A510N8T6_HALSA|nr:GNAT family N-acetyltransferase [Halobacterium salinarum]CAP14694.1 GNAT family acetyltransferase [Halobacterium salinarum R1]DAC79145.1 TPA_inf: GNAT family acetyltransferase [Halobacterium salinarum NRC-1]